MSLLLGATHSVRQQYGTWVLHFWLVTRLVACMQRRSLACCDTSTPLVGAVYQPQDTPQPDPCVPDSGQNL